MRQRIIIAIVCAVVSFGMTSCIFGGSSSSTEIGTRQQLIGHWQGVSPTTSGLHFVFYDESAEEGYCWGKTWDESDDYYESSLVYHGNGWFMWKKGTDYIRMRHMINVSQAQSAIDQTIYSLTDNNLSIQDGSKRVYLVKVVQ